MKARMLIVVSLSLLMAIAAGAQTASPAMTYAITDVKVSHNGAGTDQLRSLGYQTLEENGCISPPRPGLRTNTIPADLNRGFGGDTVSVWVRYEIVPVDSDRKVLVDLAVEDWTSSIPSCRTGFEYAGGDPKIARGSKPGCGSSGLCVKYARLKDTADGTIVTALMLSRAYDKTAGLSCSGGQCVGSTGIWNMSPAGSHVYAGCSSDKNGSPLWVYICRNGEARADAAKAMLVTPETKRSLLTTYAPRIYIAKDEKYYPSDVEWSFKNTVRYLNDDGRYWLQTREALSTNFDTLDYWYGFKDVSSAPVYAFWVDKWDAEGGPFVDLIYFTYYPYNLGKPLSGITWGNHVGDWEHLTVRLAWDKVTGSWVPHTIYFPTHDSGSAARWTNVSRAEGAHPVAYAASGSHGLWPTAASNQYKSVAGGALDLIDETSQGKAWDTWNNLIAWDYPGRKPLTGAPWPAWMNNDYARAGSGDPTNPSAGPIYRWGNVQRTCPYKLGVCRLENGPTGPPDKDVWRSNVFQ